MSKKLPKTTAKEGRPTKYTPDLIKKVDEYLATCVDKEDKFHKTRSKMSNSYERIVNVNLPKIEGFARYIDVHKDTLYEWAKENDEFSDALDRITAEQHNRLIDGSLSGKYSPVISKLMLSSNHGYRDKSDVTSDGKALVVQTINYADDNSTS